MVVELANLPGDRIGRVFRRPGGMAYRSTNDTLRGAEGGQIKRAFASAVKAAKIDRHLTPHQCRHTRATWSYGLDRNLIRLRQDGGWRSTSQVERYTKLASEALRREIRAFWRLSTTNPEQAAAPVRESA